MPPISDLENRVTTLAARFLDPQIEKETEATFSPDLDAIAAFRLLVHAEIEEWLEQCASDELALITKRIEKESSLRSISRIIFLATHFSLPLSCELPHNEAKFKIQLDKILSHAKSFIKDNNGIKANRLY